MSEATITPDRDQLKIVELQQKVQALQHMMQNNDRDLQRRFRIKLMLSSVVLVLSMFSIHRVSSLMRQLDPDTVARIGRMQIEESLPRTRTSMQGYLIRQTPKIVASAFDSFTLSVPAMRKGLEQHLHSRVATGTANFENTLIGHVSAKIPALTQQIDAAYPDADPDTKLRRLIDRSTSGFSTAIDESLAIMYPKFSSQLSQVEGFLKDRNSDMHLTDREQKEAEILEVLMSLVLREQHGER